VLHTLVLILFGIMPALSLFGHWDSYPSAALYSGNTADAVIYVGDSALGRLPAETREFVRWQSGTSNVLSISRWSMKELNVPPYPEPRIFKNVARQICAYAGTTAEVTLTIQGRPHWRTGDRATTRYDCSAL
jgi:hypothetical protein